MKRRLHVVLPLAALAVVAGVVAGAFALGDRDERGRRAGDADPQRCKPLSDDERRACYVAEFGELLRGKDDPRPTVEAIADIAWREGGFLLANCHGAMHTVARGYAQEVGVTLGTLMEYLPRSNDPGCSAGFAHGLVTAVAPEIDAADAGAAATVCADAPTRYQRYSCTHGFGHAFMRVYDGEVGAALDLCRTLGAQAAPDCAQGVYHDYWFAVAGADDAPLAGEPVTDPRRLCGAQPPEFVRQCWYRAYVDNRPSVDVDTPDDLEELCAGLAGLQRASCITAASVIGPPDPRVQLAICSVLDAASDARACIRGAKVQNLLGRPLEQFVEVIRECELFTGDRTRTACYEWLGKTISVVTDSEFERAGCPRLSSVAARRACRAGARSAEEPLVTFS